MRIVVISSVGMLAFDDAVAMGRCAVSSHDVCLARAGRRMEVRLRGLRPVVAGIIGAGRWWTAWMISVLSIPRR